ncbi:hypothetical protein [Desulfallas thermosapovorans]|uniref:hypothetical protein n=1 Tax=Desulfallas thermosapovorans TaxID=58137 RepID=UPI0014134537|nr:hypothetical protein [Desulfallas thermosapovorans]
MQQHYNGAGYDGAGRCFNLGTPGTNAGERELPPLSVAAEKPELGAMAAGSLSTCINKITGLCNRQPGILLYRQGNISN